MDGQAGVIDGWLKLDGVMLRPRQGRPIASAREPAWEMLPATMPTTAPDPQARLLTLQEQCLAHALPAGTVAYTEDPAVAAGLADLRERYAPVSSQPASSEIAVPPVALREPPFWAALRELSATLPVGYVTTKPYPMLFLHERTTPSGQPRVVVVQWVAETGHVADVSRLLAGRMHAPASRTAAATLIDHVQVRVRLPAPDPSQGRPAGAHALNRQRPQPLTLFAGQPDPDDASHFTIPYAFGENAGVIDGWVSEDKLVLKPRLGDVSVAQGQQTWVLGAAAAANPSTRPATGPGTGR